MPYATDYHVHTFRCGHAGGASRDYVRTAIAKGLDEIAFTDHVPLYFMEGDDPLPEFAMAKDELDGYVAEVLALREEFRGDIDVLLGLECDYVEGREPELRSLLSPYPWDVLLGSVHWVAGAWIDAPGSARRHEVEGSRAIFSEYYRLLSLAAASGMFDVLTHFDLPKKFGHRRPFECAGDEAAAVEAARESGIAVELSSAGLRKPIGEPYPAPPLLRALVLAEIPLVLSSDAHAPQEVAWGRAAILETAAAAGAVEHVSFSRRKRTRHPL